MPVAEIRVSTTRKPRIDALNRREKSRRGARSVLIRCKSNARSCGLSQMRERDKNHAANRLSLSQATRIRRQEGTRELGGRGRGGGRGLYQAARVCRARARRREREPVLRSPEVHCPHCGGGCGIVLARRRDKGVPGSVSFVDKLRIIAIARRSASHSHEARRARSDCGTWKIIIRRINWTAARTCACETSSLLE